MEWTSPELNGINLVAMMVVSSFDIYGIVILVIEMIFVCSRNKDCKISSYCSIEQNNMRTSKTFYRESSYTTED